ncbi:MAG: Cof-type HAD-IIB family hydrolase [Bacillota bacterium]|nr:Cof-type HAD-IIB family hydrolase [Bacillota bacterium]HHU62022.1 HAD family phosphatase [Natronincola sp.]
MYKLIGLDLDGTLLNNTQEVSEINQYWIKQAEDAGIIVSFATGRGRISSEQFWPLITPTSPMIVTNGAEVWKNHNELLSRHNLPENTMERLYQLAIKYDIWFWAHGESFLTNKDTWNLEEHTLNEHKWLKFGVVHEEPKVLQEIREIVESWGGLEVTASAPTNLEIVKEGVSKASGLQEVTKLLGIKPSEVVVMGDSLNDLDMIKWAGLGVAMANAEPVLKEAADKITLTNEENGVAEIIRSILK